MHQSNKNGQCLICFGCLDDDYDLYSLLCHPVICQKCLHSFQRYNHSVAIDSYQVTILYYYNDFFRNLLFGYKGKYDYALRDAFLNSYRPTLKKKYHNHVVVVVPSSNHDNKVRGFCPNQAIATTFSANVFTGLYKKTNYKQTSQKDRSKVKKILAINQGEQLENRKILLFDDVITSASTIKAAIDLIRQYSPASIEVLVLASNQIDRFESDKSKMLKNIKLILHRYKILPIKKNDF